MTRCNSKIAIIFSLALFLAVGSARAQDSAPPAEPLEPIHMNQENPPPAQEDAAKKFKLEEKNRGADGVAQSINLAELSGKVTDDTGEEAVNDAHIVLSEVGQEHKRYQFETNPKGEFTIKNIAPGTYTINVSAKDKLSYTQQIQLSVGDAQALAIKMEDTEGTDILRITGKRTLIQPENIGSETRLDKTFIDHYKTGNDLRQLIQSTPGVVPDTYGNIITRGEHNSVNYVLDDVVLPEAAGVLQQSQFVSPRSLDSMKVDIGGYQAEDGGGPLGAVVHMKSNAILPTPNFQYGNQLGDPLAGNLWYSGSTAFSQDPNNPLYRLRIESSGAFRGSAIGQSPPVKDYTHNNRWDINSLTKLQYTISEQDIISMTLGINHTLFQVPTSRTSAAAGVNENQQDATDYVIVNYKHKFKKFFDEGNLHILNAVYWETFRSRTAFDPTPVINGGQPFQSISPQALRFDYIFSAQGDLRKTFHKTHFLKLGFLSEVRPVYTDFSGTYFNNDPTSTTAPYGAVISPFTNAPGGPQFTKNMGKYHGFRYVQSGYFQDTWRPQTGILKRLTVDAGVRVDVYHGVFGNTMQVADAIASIPGAAPFNLQPFQTQRVTDAQASGRYGGSFVLDKNTVIRGSYSDLFMPPNVDIFSTPPSVAGGLVNGYYNGLVENVYNGTIRPMRATRGHLIDTSLERQIGPRFVGRSNLFYKTLENYGDSGVIGNTTLYNRQSVDKQEAYGVENRFDLKPDKRGYGWNGFVSNTIAVAYLRGSKQVIGGIYDIQTTPVEQKYPDHDRRISLNAGLGYTTRFGWWTLADFQFLSGLQNDLPVPPYPPHASRTPVLATFNFSTGFKIPQKLKRSHPYFPDAIDLRIQNVLNNREATNLGSPFQGTRYLLPFNFLVGCSWNFGKTPQQLGSASQSKPI